MNNIYDGLYEKLAHVQGLLCKQEIYGCTEYGQICDTGREQGRVLAMLKIKPEISTGDLSYLLDIHQKILIEILNEMEKSGYVQCTQQEGNKETILVNITEKGREFRPAEKDSCDIFSCLSEKELQDFGEYLDRIIAFQETRLAASWRIDDRADWQKRAREHLGDEQFDELIEELMKRHRQAFIVCH